jgi:polysaccharide deacetylase family protein (PEP-CTERM system associated)
MAPPVAFTLDLEDHLGRYNATSRYLAVTPRILDFLDELGVRGTVFVVARIAEASPALVREVARRGHEVACHSYTHRPLTLEYADNFYADTRRAKEVLEECIGRPVTGYRAPVFSLTRASPWAESLLAEIGFRYSSSVLPARNPLHGFAGAPRTPFRWPSGLVELPCPVGRLGPLTLPYLGGVYLRYLPRRLRARLLGRAGPGEVLWTYIHPYDFDADEPYARFAGTSAAESLLLWRNRRETFARVRDVLAGGALGALGEIAGDPAFRAALPVFDPEGA